MIELPGFTSRDRVLVVAPHPDDESIATGGVLQAARAAAADCRVLLVTDGDNNPWPQRWVEKRWHIGAVARARWGVRRRAEALAALQTLGIGESAVRCLGLPDLGLTDALMRGTPDVAGLLSTEIAAFAPTRIFLPALDDRHPDHSALHILVRLALGRDAATNPALFAFGVHGIPDPRDMVALTLTEPQRETKAAAIIRHTTQMRLSRRRFVGYAKSREPFRAVASLARPEAGHPLQSVPARSGELAVTIDRHVWRRSLTGYSLFVVLERRERMPWRGLVALSGTRHGTVIDPATQRHTGSAQVETTGRTTTVSIAVDAEHGGGWVKLGRPAPGLFVFDKTGWQIVAGAES